METNSGIHIKKVYAARELLKKNIIINSKLRGYVDQKRQIYNIIKRTVFYSESDSLLLVSPRGCGKTTLVSSCLNDLEVECGGSDDYIVIHLNGLVHTDDNLALKDIIQQLHVEELDGDRISGSFSDNLFFVLQSLRSGDRTTSKAVIFILDEFHYFCNHRNQTLLYNLFDVAQSAQAPICVIGLTTRIDITEMLEKRVKSRFSHRQVMLYPNNNIAERLICIIDYLSLPEDSKLIVKPLDKHFSRLWNDKILQIFKSQKIILLVKRQLELDPSQRKLKTWLLSVISKISEENPFITEEIVEEVIGNYRDARVELLKDLSILEFCLIIAMSHHNEIYDEEPFNFEMIFKRYNKFARQNSTSQIIQRPILLKGFERLAELELIMPINSGNKAFKREYQLHNLLVTKTQVKDAANSYIGLPTDVAQWASSSLFSL
ncbi:origin recognition complex subunit 4 isoform X1 [Rhodnius prolixus]|uniref:origin recognition complex subunit 4 isoform X1 n=1 Tax=Rhodnius prolixus TaxID=13249 RepID=UPI003D18E83B